MEPEGIKKIHPRVSTGTFAGLAKANLPFQNVLGELIDNSFAASVGTGSFCEVNIILEQTPNSSLVDLYVYDNCCGMTVEELEQALDLGNPPTSSSRLNEHGFGMKNALATLTNAEHEWTIWTKKKGSSDVISVSGPYDGEMSIRLHDKFPDRFEGNNISTLTYAQVPLFIIQGVQGKGRKSGNIDTLKNWLIEHLSVMYRGLLRYDQDRRGYPLSITLTIVVNGSSTNYTIDPAEIDYSEQYKDDFKVELNGETINCQFIYGKLYKDRVSDTVVIRGPGGKKEVPYSYYYQKDQRTQGIDVSINGRVIANSCLEVIWTDITRHNRFNRFVGELLIPELPRGVLTTVNNKSAFNDNDESWQILFNEIRLILPKPLEDGINSQSETELRKTWTKKLKDTNPDDTIDQEHYVWETGTRIDVYRKDRNDDVTIYELKIGKAEPLHVYQLLMYWDGLVLKGEQPYKGILLVKECPDIISTMVKTVNEKLTPPKINIGGELVDSKPYNLIVKTHKEVGLD